MNRNDPCPSSLVQIDAALRETLKIDAKNVAPQCGFGTAFAFLADHRKNPAAFAFHRRSAVVGLIFAPFLHMSRLVNLY